MGIFIAAILFGMGFAFLALQNTSVVSLRAGTYVFTSPLFAVVLGSLLVGLFLAWILSALGWISNSMFHKRHTIEENSERTIDTLETRVRELEFENERLHREKTTTPKSVFEHIRTNFSPH